MTTKTSRVKQDDITGAVSSLFDYSFSGETVFQIPRLGSYRDSSKLWRPTSKNHRARNDYDAKHKTKEDNYKMRHAHRLCYSHEFVGVANGKPEAA